MKKFFTLVAMMLALTTTTVTLNSCGDDDDDPAVVVSKPAEDVAGSYTGDGTMTVMGSSFDYPNVTYQLAAASDDVLMLTIPATGSGTMKFPDLKVENIQVKKLSDGSYQLADTEYKGSIVVDGVTKNYTVTVSSSTVSGTTLKLNYSLQYGSMPMAMVTTFEGTKAN